MSDLFRREAVQHATRRLSGSVVLATPPSVIVLGGLLVALVIGATLFASTATYARKSTVSGWLVPDQGLIRATASTQGLVAALFVKEGQIVTKGTRIAQVELSTETARGNLAEALARGIESEGQALKAKYAAQSARFNIERAQVESRIKALDVELEQSQGQVRLQQERVDLANDLVAKSKQLARKGYLSNSELSARLSAALAAEQELVGKRRQVTTVESQKVELQARLAAFPEDIANASADLRSAEASLSQRAADVDGRHSQYIIAPVDGVVATIPVFIGQSVVPGASIAVITPKNAQLEAELLAPSRSAGFIQEGQSVLLMLQAFPFQRFGALEGTIRSVSSTVLTPNEVSIPGLRVDEPVFRVRVSIARETVSAYGKAIQLQPGMLLSADVVLDRRSLIAWLFDPIYAAGRRI